MPHFHVSLNVGCATSSRRVTGRRHRSAAVLHLTPADALQLRTWISEKLLPELCARPHVVAAHLWTLAHGEPASQTTTLSRGEPEHQLAWVLVVETADPATAEAMEAAILTRDPKAHGATEIVACPTYRLLYAVDPR